MREAHTPRTGDELDEADGVIREHLLRAEERGLGVEGDTTPRGKGSGDVQGRAVHAVLDEGGRQVPNRVTTGLKGSARSTC